MRIINKDEFYKLPPGTVCSYYEPTVITGLFIKEETISTGETPFDFFYTDLIGNVDTTHSDPYLYDDMDEGKEFGLGFQLERDGIYDENEQYALYSEKEVKQLIELLQNTLKK